MASVESKFTSKRVSIFLLFVWALLIVATIWIDNFWISLASISLGGALPFLILAIWFPRWRLGKFLQEAGSVWQLRIFGISALFVYSVYAKKWASDVINELFHVDSRYFGLSTTVLAVLFTPFGLIYREDVIGWLWIVFILLGMLLTYVLPLSLLTPGRPALGWKAWVGGILFFLVGAFVLAMSGHLAKLFKPLAMQFTIWADFNENHLCADDWANQPNSVVFLGDQRVLVYFPKKPSGMRFSVESCNFKRNF